MFLTRPPISPVFGRDGCNSLRGLQRRWHFLVSTLTPRTVRAAQPPLGRCVALNGGGERPAGHCAVGSPVQHDQRVMPTVSTTSAKNVHHPAVVGFACHRGVLPGWIGFECARRANPASPTQRPSAWYTEGKAAPARGPERSSRLSSVTSRLHPRIVTHAHGAVFVWSVWCLVHSRRFIVPQGLTGHCAVSPVRCDLGVASPAQSASRQLRSSASATRSRLVLGQSRCTPTRSASRPSRRPCSYRSRRSVDIPLRLST